MGFDALPDLGKHGPMHRVLPGLVVVCLAAFVLAAPSTVEAKQPGRPNPKPTPTVQPTPPAPTPTPSPTPAPTTPPGSLEGIDVSYHQGPIDWAQVAASGKRYVFVRATAGTLTADTAYWTNRAGARAGFGIDFCKSAMVD